MKVWENNGTLKVSGCLDVKLTIAERLSEMMNLAEDLKRSIAHRMAMSSAT